MGHWTFSFVRDAHILLYLLLQSPTIEGNFVVISTVAVYFAGVERERVRVEGYSQQMELG